jgi:ABC-type cobalamin/Fe3+-siderophores transport system ATPase subunit
MDEPIFALQDGEKTRIMELLADYAHRESLRLFNSAHELEISGEYADYLLLLYASGPPRLGPTVELFAKEGIETAYQVPCILLRRKEALIRENLVK